MGVRSNTSPSEQQAMSRKYLSSTQKNISH